MDHLKCVQKLWLTWVYTNLNLNIDTITPEEYFKDSYVEELSGQGNVCTSTKPICKILGAKYGKSDF